MGKKLVTIDKVDALICHDEKKIHVDNTMLLTPGAKDHLSNKGISIVYGAAPQRSDRQQLQAQVHRILKEQYGITQPEELAAIGDQVINAIESKPQ